MKSVQLRKRGLCKVIGWTCWIVTAFPAASTAKEALSRELKPSVWSTAEDKRLIYATELRKTLVSYGIHPVDANEILAPLVKAGLIKSIDEDCSNTASTRYRKSLIERSNSILKLRNLTLRMRQSYKITFHPNRHSHIIDGDETFTPLVQSWLNLRLKSVSYPSDIYVYDKFLKEHTNRQADHRWNRPIRIPSSGDKEYDDIIRSALAGWKSRVASLPIDDNSFPAALSEANVFVDHFGFQCGIHIACQRVQTSDLNRIERDAERQKNEDPARYALIFFDQLRQGNWQPAGTLFGISAASALRQSTAYYRVSVDGKIDAAMCQNSVGPGYRSTVGFTPNGNTIQATREDMELAVSQCLGAAMGAPAEASDWTIAGKQAFRERTACVAKREYTAQVQKIGSFHFIAS